MRRVWTILAVVTLVLVVSGVLTPEVAWAADPPPQSANPPVAVDEGLLLFTDYPSQVVGMDDNVSINLKLRSQANPQIARLEVKELPEGWTATFRGGGKIIHSVYVQPDDDASVTLRLEPPQDVAAGTYNFVAVARGERLTAELPLELTVQDRLPPSLSFDVDLPIIKGKPTSTFRYSATLKNEGDEDLTINLLADAPPGFVVTFKTGGQEVTTLPLEANQSKSLSIEARPFIEVPAGNYAINVHAQGNETEASVSLTAEVTGEVDLNVTAPDGRLSARAYAGEETPLKVIVQNTGSAPARAIELSSTEPSGWSVEFDPKKIDQIGPGKQVEVTARIRPADKAVAGDYMMTVRARPEDGASESAEFRITVLTSTLWGVAGVALIAVAVGVVALAVLRFGRR
ncbi:MAG: NEW3 domain-containing protein [Anaerolineae bacterium]